MLTWRGCEPVYGGCVWAVGGGLAAALTWALAITAKSLSPPWCNIYPGSGYSSVTL